MSEKRWRPVWYDRLRPMHDHGAVSRMKILEESATRNILDPLSTHGWTASIVSKNHEDSGYLIIEAKRASGVHCIAFLYTTAVANALYKRLESQVEAFFINGALYHVDEYAYGIKAPVKPVDEFFSTLLKWNNEVSPGKLAVDFKASGGVRQRRDYQLIRSENPIQQIWSQLDQMGSVQLAKTIVRERGTLGQELIESKAVGLAYSVRNASDYFLTHIGENISQRILNRYYGTLSFAFAELLAAPDGVGKLAEIEESTKFGHGLYTVDGENEDFPTLTVGPLSRGFFPKWMKSLGKDISAYPAKKPTDASDLIRLQSEMCATVCNIFARIPEVGDLFLDIFDAAHLWVTPVHDSEANPAFLRERTSDNTYALLIDHSCRLEGADIAKTRASLSQIQFIKANGQGRHFRALVDVGEHKIWWDAIKPIHHSPFTSITGALILPMFGGISDFRIIAFVLLYALSIIVRYRPSLWRRIQEADWDQYKVLIHATLDVLDRVLPQEFLQSITGRRIVAAVPGSIFG